ncbi:MAG: DUF1214 domain-containing protein [Oceanicaulis sp.]|nr:DUF1214 domain-containing protein [Oceanicaulis sp.]
MARGGRPDRPWGEPRRGRDLSQYGHRQRGRALTGDHTYQIHFGADRMPPVDAFWSVTVYDAQGYLMDTPSNRYAIHSQSDLVRDADAD